MNRAFLLSILCLLAAACSAGPKILAAEPPNGALFPGETALFDDGTCPAGQVKQVTGGSNRVYGTDLQHNGVARRYACVARPS